jgi:hypothetical protein
MLSELRLYPHRLAARFGTLGRGKSAHGGGVRVSPNLFTAFAKGQGPRSTAADTSIPSLSSAQKENAG